MDNKIKDDQRPAQDEPQVIADIQVNTDMTAAEQFKYEYNTCCLCGSQLNFTHTTHFGNNEVVEEAHCSSCQVRTKEQMHRLH